MRKGFLILGVAVRGQVDSPIKLIFPVLSLRYIFQILWVHPAHSFGIITWEVLCGEGRMPWNSERLDCLPLTLKMGKKLEIPEDCSRFYR